MLAALATARYRPDSSQRLRHLALRCPGDQPLRLVPYERFTPDITESTRGYDRRLPFNEVLVCWLDEEQFDGKLRAISDLVAFICEHSNLETLQWLAGEPPKVRVVGPSNSDSLVAMALENHQYRQGPEFFAPLRFAVFALSALRIAKGMSDRQRQLRDFDRLLTGRPQQTPPPLGTRSVPESSCCAAWLRAPRRKLRRRCAPGSRAAPAPGGVEGNDRGCRTRATGRLPTTH